MVNVLVTYQKSNKIACKNEQNVCENQLKKEQKCL